MYIPFTNLVFLVCSVSYKLDFSALIYDRVEKQGSITNSADCGNEVHKMLSHLWIPKKCKSFQFKQTFEFIGPYSEIQS